MKHNNYFIIAFISIVLIGSPWLINNSPRSLQFVDEVFYRVQNNFATVYLHNVITSNQLREKYNAAIAVEKSKIRILIMPGHEANYGGSEYKNLKERDMNVELGKELQSFLRGNNRYDAILARDENSWNIELQNYFDNHWNEIISFFNERKSEMITSLKDGVVIKKDDGIKHNTVPKNVANRLYGINKWVNDNRIDIAIHIHFNDNPRRDVSVPGEYSGIAIYVPERQYFNSTTTKEIANSVYKRLTKYNATSNFSTEDQGIVEDQDLIAIGSNNTVDAPSMLIEYGYIYEPQFADSKVRELTIRDLAFQTYLGIQDFFGSGNDVSLVYDTLMLPYSWKENITKNTDDKESVLALQSALLLEGLYPNRGDSKNDCPRTGKFGPCTLNSLNKFQNINNINNEKGVVGQKTIELLNKKYSVKNLY